MLILIAPNAFKNSLPAEAAAAQIRKGLERSGLLFRSRLFPVGDGGDGTAALLAAALGAELVRVRVHDPIGRLVDSSFGWLAASQTAIIELADASGLRLLSPGEYDPLRANTRGTGECIRHALGLGARQIILGIGGSATVDGGLGILTEMGIRLLAAGGRTLETEPARLTDLQGIDASYRDARLSGAEITVLCDVDNPLTGPDGAAAVFGPQKGAGPAEVSLLDAALDRFAAVSLELTGTNMRKIKSGGAAGGVAAGLALWLGARLVSGIDYFLDHLAFDKALTGADLVITGEGRLDKQTLNGKAPLGVAKRAREKGISVLALAGSLVKEDRPALEKYFDRLIEINPASLPLADAIRNSAHWLEHAAYLLGKELASGRQ